MFNSAPANKKVLIGLIVAGVVLIGGIVFIVLRGSGASSDENTIQTADGKTIELKPVKACGVFNLDEAKELLGKDTSEANNANEVTTGDISVDTCSYTNNATNAADIRIITVMARSALTSVGQDSNIGAFDKNGTANPNGAVAVNGLSDKAYWDPASHQLTILNGNTWFSIVYGGTNPANNTLEDAKKVAELTLN